MWWEKGGNDGWMILTMREREPGDRCGYGNGGTF